MPKLDEVKDRVRDDVISAARRELSSQRRERIAAKLKSAPDFAAAAKAQGFEAKDTELIARGRAAAGPRRQPGGRQGRVRAAGERRQRSDHDRQRHGDRPRVEKEEGDAGGVRKAKETFREELLNERRSRFFAAYMAKAKEKMKIEVNSDVVQRIVAMIDQLDRGSESEVPSSEPFEPLTTET